MRRILLLGLAMLASACGRPTTEVYSRHPLLAPAEGGPRLKPGLWRWDSGDCAFDEAKPSGSWPACVVPVVVRADEILTAASGDAVLREGYVFADGRPMILQVQLRLEPPPDPVEQQYFGVRPTLVDGQVVAMERWPVTCTPSPKGGAQTDNAAPTPRPSLIKGLTVGDDGRCLTGSRDQLRAAVIASEVWTADRQRLRWVRSAEQ